MISIDYRQAQKEIFQILPSRSQDVLRRRFQLDYPHRETLDTIGRDLSVTRERVRQIEETSLAKLREAQTPQAKEIRKAFRQYLNEHGGLRREEYVLEDLASKEADRLYVRFFLVLEPDFFDTKADELVYPFWATEEKNIELAHKIVEQLVKEIEKRHQSLSEEEIVKIYPAEETVIRSCLEVARQIERGIDGGYGLADWPEVCPQRLKDKAYLVLKETKQPLHFMKVAELINEFNPRWERIGCRRPRQALAQTVHNELIRDPRFVLVGRGLYALREWGYQPGTVKDLIVKVLKEAGQPLTREEIVDRVLGQRFVKETTILLNLSSRDEFRRLDDKTYWLAE